VQPTDTKIWTRFRVRLALLVAVVALWPTAALATAAGETTSEGDTILNLDAGTVRIIVSVVIPLLVGVLTKASWSGTVKGLLSLFLNFVSAGVIAATTENGNAVWSQATLREAVLGFAVSVAIFLGGWKQAGISSAPGGKLANVGVK
jgi:hypothetical protein